MNPTKTTPKDFFLHLAATIVLYSGAIALVNLSFAIINYAFPDALANYFYTSSVAWPISMLVVLVPLLYVIEWFIKKDIKAHPEKETLWIRRWRTYLTLFLTGATIIGDLIALINTYLNGEITSRFVYKFIAILVIFGVIFAYYLLEKSATVRKTAETILAWIGIIIVLAAVIGGFVTTGSPSKQRALRFDNQRVNDLSNIQQQVVYYWQQKGKLPPTLADLRDSISGQIIPVDPETKSAYLYTVKSNLNFQLCADFAEKTLDTKGRGGYGDMGMSYPSMPYPVDASQNNWAHSAGNVCFDRTIDPEIYSLNKPLK